MKKIVFIILLINLTGCLPKQCRFTAHYDFSLSASLSPVQETYSVGDTLFISSTFDNKIYEATTDQFYQLTNFNFFPKTIIHKIDNPLGPDDLSSFDIIIPAEYNYHLDNYSSGDQQLNGTYLEKNNQYELNFQIVLKQPGLYFLKQASAIYGRGGNQYFENKCRNKKIDASVSMNQGASNNIHLLKESQEEHYNSWILEKPQDRFHRFGGYCFRVE